MFFFRLVCTVRDIFRGLGSPRIAIGLFTIGLLLGCANGNGKSIEPIADDTRGIITAKQVVLVVVDALKASELGTYGYDRNTSPHLTALAREGILFEQFRAASCWTVPSFATLLTGMAPSAAHAGDIFDKGRYERGAPKLRKDIPTLAEYLGDDIASAALVTNPYLHPYRGLGRGFDTYDHENADHHHYRNAKKATDKAIGWLSRHKDAPFFYLLHLFDPHVPYRAPAPIERMFVGHEPGRLDIDSRDQFREIRSHALKLTDDEKGYLRDLYDAEVRFVDEQLGRLIDAMDDMGILETSYVVFTADHGEEHFEHGGFEHGHRFEDEVVRVPLVIRAPGGKWHAGQRVPWSAGHADIYPTIVEWFGKAIPRHLGGESLNPLITGESQAHRTVYMEHNLYGPYRFAWFDGRYKLITDRAGQSTWLYDLDTDPLEKHRLQEHAEIDAMKANLLQHRAQLARRVGPQTGAPETPPQVPADVQTALRSLGYID